MLGRDAEIRQVIDILTRRRQNNPILTGEAGVGKTAVVEGFALRVVQGDVPPPLKKVQIRTLDLALLQAGAGVKGEFENRLKGLIEEVKASATPIILFIDEAHTMIGAGGQAGQGDAANLLKPALARGELRTVAATTWSEYKKYFEKDAALARRFQVVKVEEPSEPQCMVMIRGLVASLEKHHKVRILDDAVAASVRLSHRYLAGRQLPDKAVSIEQADRLVRQLAAGEVAVRQLDGVRHRLVQDAHLVMRFQRRRQATDHDACIAARSGSSTLTTWKRLASAASFSKYFLYSDQVVAAMVRSSPRARAGLSRLAASPCPAWPPAPIMVWASSMNRMMGVGRCLDLFDQTLEPVLELALDAGAGLQQGQVERADLHILQRRRHVAL